MHVAHRLERPGIASQFIITSFHVAGTQCVILLSRLLWQESIKFNSMMLLPHSVAFTPVLESVSCKISVVFY